jgi:hypothetical protein
MAVCSLAHPRFGNEFAQRGGNYEARPGPRTFARTNRRILGARFISPIAGKTRPREERLAEV